MYSNPSTYSIGFAIISLLLANVSRDQDKIEIISNIDKKFTGLPNTGIMQVWFQRMLIGLENLVTVSFTELLCSMKDSYESIWNDTWLKDNDMKLVIEKTSIFNREEYLQLDPIIGLKEFALFDYNDSIENSSESDSASTPTLDHDEVSHNQDYEWDELLDNNQSISGDHLK